MKGASRRGPSDQPRLHPDQACGAALRNTRSKAKGRRKAIPRHDSVLQLNAELHRLILEAVPAGIVHIAQEGAIHHANELALEILGLAHDELVRLDVASFQHKTFREDGSECPVEEYPVS
jgi:PAS domain-containing protein